MISEVAVLQLDLWGYPLHQASSCTYHIARLIDWGYPLHQLDTVPYQLLIFWVISDCGSVLPSQQPGSLTACMLCGILVPTSPDFDCCWQWALMVSICLSLPMPLSEMPSSRLHLHLLESFDLLLLITTCSSQALDEETSTQTSQSIGKVCHRVTAPWRFGVRSVGDERSSILGQYSGWVWLMLYEGCWHIITLLLLLQDILSFPQTLVVVVTSALYDIPTLRLSSLVLLDGCLLRHTQVSSCSRLHDRLTDQSIQAPRVWGTSLAKKMGSFNLNSQTILVGLIFGWCHDTRLITDQISGDIQFIKTASLYSFTHDHPTLSVCTACLLWRPDLAVTLRLHSVMKTALRQAPSAAEASCQQLLKKHGIQNNLGMDYLVIYISLSWFYLINDLPAPAFTLVL